jgi:hypothetical protein
VFLDVNIGFWHSEFILDIFVMYLLYNKIVLE